MKRLVLPLTYEDIRNSFNVEERDGKMMEFVSPLTTNEEELALIASNITTSGKLAFVLGHPGVGKSTFLHTLNWRKHLPIRIVLDIDANNFIDGSSLDGLFDEISRNCSENIKKNDKGISVIIINYLEYLDDYPDEIIKGFFRRLNGLLRSNPVLVLWPVISDSDVEKMIQFSQHVSGTLYQRDKQIIRISGPNKKDYIDIAQRTIKVLNNGLELSDFGLTHDNLVETFNDFSEIPEINQNLREYYSRILSKWESNNGYLEKIKTAIPKPTEVWFIFPFKDAEAIVNQFARKGSRIEDAWTAVSDKFSDYITGNSQRKAQWDSTRLQLALHGALKTRIMYIPTNLVITTCASFSDNQDLTSLIDKHNPPAHWYGKTQTQTSVQRSPIYKQLINEQFPSGKRKGGPVLQALNTADPIYKDLVSWISKGTGSDTHLLSAFGKALIASGVNNVIVEKEHPWIKGVYPDIQIDQGHKVVCLEFHFTYQDEPHIIADYTLKKLDVYMNQLQAYLK
ncbi:MAG: hypothetical protein ACK4RX_11050 [Chitinophagaceae bacterium]